MSHSAETWGTMDKAARIAAVIYAHNVTDGTAASIAAYLSKTAGQEVTRSAVIGFYNRNPDALRVPFPLTGHQVAAATYRAQKERAVATKTAPAPRAPRPMPAPVKPKIAKPEPKLKLLWQIEAGECKWPVEGDRDRTLFCCAPSGREVYCAYHAERGTRAVRKPAAAPVARTKRPARVYR